MQRCEEDEALQHEERARWSASSALVSKKRNANDSQTLLDLFSLSANCILESVRACFLLSGMQLAVGLLLVGDGRVQHALLHMSSRLTLQQSVSQIATLFEPKKSKQWDGREDIG